MKRKYSLSAIQYKQVYKYEEGDIAAVGIGHSSDVTKVRVAPNGQYMVSVSAEGAIMSWNLSNL